MAYNGLYSNLDITDHRYSVQNHFVGAIRKYLESCSAEFYLTEQDLVDLHSIGVPGNPTGHLSSSHPKSATIERHVLNLAASYLKDHEVTVLSSKESKARKFLGPKTLVDNPTIVPRDTYRYALDLRQDYHSVQTSHALIHDVLQLLDPSFVVDLFRRSDSLTHLYASVVIPPELLRNCSVVYGPFYEYEVIGNTLHYYPDGHREGGYSQPLDCIQFLNHHLFTSDDLSITCTLIDSFASHHLLLFTRAHIDVSEIRHFSSGSTFRMAPAWKIWSTLPNCSVPKGLMDALSVSLLSAGSYTRSKVFTRARQICASLRLKQDPTILVAVVDYCIDATLPLRDSCDYHLPVTRIHHLLTRCYAMRFIRTMLNPLAWLRAYQVSSLVGSPDTCIIKTTAIEVLPKTKRSLTATRLFMSISDNLLNALCSPFPQRPESFPLYHDCIRLLFALYWPMHLPGWPNFELHKLAPLRTNLALFPIQAACFYFLFQLARRVFGAVEAYLSHGLQCTAYLLTFYFPALNNLLVNLERVSSGHNPSNHHITRETSSATPLDSTPDVNETTLTFDYGDISSDFPAGKDTRDFKTQVNDWIYKFDIILSEWYHLPIDSNLRAPFNSRYGTDADVRGRHVICPPGPTCDPISIEEATSLLKSRPASVTLLVPDRRLYGVVIHEYRQAGYNARIENRGFKGFASCIRLRDPLCRHPRPNTRPYSPDPEPDQHDAPEAIIESEHPSIPGDQADHGQDSKAPTSLENPIQKPFFDHSDERAPPTQQDPSQHLQRCEGSTSSRSLLEIHASSAKTPPEPQGTTGRAGEGRGPNNGFHNSSGDPSPEPDHSQFEPGSYAINRNAQTTASADEPKRVVREDVSDETIFGDNSSNNPINYQQLCLRLEEQRKDNDCTIVSIAHALEISYESAEQQLATNSRIKLSMDRDHAINLADLSVWAHSSGYHLEIHNMDTGDTNFRGASTHSNRAIIYLDSYPSKNHLTTCTCKNHDLLSVYRKTTKIPLSLTRMKNYLDMIVKDKYGKVLPAPQYTGMLAGLESRLRNEPHNPTTEAFIILGQAGSGKSAGFKKRMLRYLHGNRATKWVMAFHSTEIRDMTKAEMDEHHLHAIGPHLVTPELAFTGPTHIEVLCIDELGKWKPGEAELLIYHLQPKLVILNGDPTQGRHSVAGVSHSVLLADNYLDVVSKHAKVFLNYSYRLPQNYSALYGFPCYGDPAPMPRRLKYPALGIPVLASNRSTVEAYQAAHHKSITFNSSQGWDSKERYLIILNHQAIQDSNGNFHSAITRSSAGFDYLISTGSDLQGSGDFSSDLASLVRRTNPAKLIIAFLREELHSLRNLEIQHSALTLPVHLRNPLHPDNNTFLGSKKAAIKLINKTEEWLSKSSRGPSNLDLRLERLDEQDKDFSLIDDPPEVEPFLKSDSFEELRPDLEFEDLDHQLLHCSDHTDNLDAICLDHFGVPSTKDEREKMYRGLQTDQVDDASIARSVFIRHSAKDPTCLPMSIKARIAKRKTNALSDLITHKFGTDALVAVFKNLAQKDELPFDEEAFHAKRIRSYENLLYKDNALNLSKAYKCDLGTKESHTFLLLKQQYVNKIGKIYSAAKNGQILTEYVFRVALDLGPVFMYILERCQEIFEPHNIYLHPGHSDAQFVELIKTKWDHSIESMEDDATNWDTNVGPALIGFGYFLMDFFNIPSDLKKRYIEFKNEMHAVHMAIKFMMASGGPDTLPLNTIWGAMVQLIRCDVPKGALRIHGGDDVAINAPVRISQWWHNHSHYIPEVFKTVRTYHPTCFGWRIYPEPHRDPATVLARVIYSVETDRISRTLPDLMSIAQELINPSTYEQLSELEQYHTDTALSILAEQRILTHHSVKGQTKGKRGSIRRYNMENSALFNPNL